MQERRRLTPHRLAPHIDDGDEIDEQTLAMFTHVLGVHTEVEGLGHGDRPQLFDHVLGVHRTDRRERKAFGHHHFHHEWERENERVRQRQRVAETQPAHLRVLGEVVGIDRRPRSTSVSSGSESPDAPTTGSAESTARP